MTKSPFSSGLIRVRWSRTLSVLAIMAVLSIVASCSGTPESGPELYEKMIDAYGGKDNLDKVTSYSGKGFFKQVPMRHVAKSFPFDIYQNDLLLKTKLMNVEGGRLIGLRLVIGNDRESYNWSNVEGKRLLPDWERDLLKYRFPYVLEWIAESGIETSIVQMEGDPNLMALRIQSGTDKLTLGIEKGTWLLTEMHLTSDADSTFLFREKYSDFRDLDGTIFPSRFSAYFGPQHYFEYYLVKIELGTGLPDEFFELLPEDTTGIYYPDESSAGAEEEESG